MTDIVLQSIIQILIGIVVLDSAILDYINHKRFKAQSVNAEGVVIALDNNGEHIAPVVKFISQSGDTIVFHSTVNGRDSRYSYGKKVNVYYSPSNPKDAVVMVSKSNRIYYIIMAVAGAFFIVTGIVNISVYLPWNPQ